jgi:NADP-dependent 3-hydroxy acid dehydrogenase YdfG
VLLNSGAGHTARAGWASYAASKFALRALADALRAEEEGNGVRVTSVHPGRTDTGMQRDVVRQEGAQYRAHEYLRPESVAAAVAHAVRAPRDAEVTEVVVRPARQPNG